MGPSPHAHQLQQVAQAAEGEAQVVVHSAAGPPPAPSAVFLITACTSCRQSRQQAGPQRASRPLQASWGIQASWGYTSIWVNGVYKQASTN